MDVLGAVNGELDSGLYFHDIRNMKSCASRQRPGKTMKLDDAAGQLEALGNATRLKIYRALVRAGHPGLAVGGLQEKLKIAPSTLSHHIKSLVSAGLVRQERASTTLMCHANYDAMHGLVNFLVSECCADVTEVATKDSKSAA